MTKQQKLLESLRQAKTCKWNKIETLFNQLGYAKKEMEGSRVRFYNKATGAMALIHCPHHTQKTK